MIDVPDSTTDSGLGDGLDHKSNTFSSTSMRDDIEVNGVDQNVIFMNVVLRSSLGFQLCI